MPTKNELDSNYPIEVAAGGTGSATQTAYTVMCGGTTAPGALQNVAGLGTAGQVLTSNGAAALPTFQTFTATASGLNFIATGTPDGSNNVTFTSGVDSAVTPHLLLVFNNVTCTVANPVIEYSTDGGTTWVASNFFTSTFQRAYNSTTYTNYFENGGFGYGMSPDTTFPVNGFINLYNAGVAANPYDPAMVGLFTSKNSGTFSMNEVYGFHDGNIAVNAIRVIRIATGSISMYGYYY